MKLISICTSRGTEAAVWKCFDCCLGEVSCFSLLNLRPLGAASLILRLCCLYDSKIKVSLSFGDGQQTTVGESQKREHGGLAWPAYPWPSRRHELTLKTCFFSATDSVEVILGSNIFLMQVSKESIFQFAERYCRACNLRSRRTR